MAFKVREWRTTSEAGVMCRHCHAGAGVQRVPRVRSDGRPRLGDHSPGPCRNLAVSTFSKAARRMPARSVNPARTPTVSRPRRPA